MTELTRPHPFPGADGIKSMVRPLVVGEDAYRSARPSGSSAFRFMLPSDLVRSIAGNIDVVDRSRPATLDVHLALDPTNRSVVLYPCRDYNMVNFVCIAPDSMLGKQTTESWTADGDRQDLLRCFDDFGPYIKQFLEYAVTVQTAGELRLIGW
jgi:salicylate hydroxylase